MPRLCRRVVLAGSTLLLVLAGSTRAQQPASETPSSPPTFRVDTPELPAPDEKGRIAYIATIPSTGLVPGRYEVRAILRQGDFAVEETTFFNMGAPAAASSEPAPGKGR